MRKIRLTILICLVIAAGLAAVGFVMVVPVHAQSANNMLWGGQEGNIQSVTGLGQEDPRIVIANIIRIVLGFLGIIAVIILIYGGWLWMTSAGDASRVDKAKKVLIAAAIGLVIILLSFAIATFILNKLFTATVGCTDGDTRVCGCGGMGMQTCTSNTWGTCVGDCTQCCCLGVCQACPCGTGPGPTFCDGNTMMAGCQPDDTMCSTGYYCASSTCTCQLAGSYGDPCDSDTGTPACEPDDAMCHPYLSCDSIDCICLGGPVIEWINPVGGFCDGSINTPCQSDSDCIAFTPATCNLDVPNGAVGNLITIGGVFFGTTTGNVYFWDGSGFNILAPFPNTVNPNCNDNWHDNQIIVVVPSGAVAGPIRIEKSSGETDDTNDTRGPNVPDFIINTIVKPGLCKLTPNHGLMNDSITYDGINLLGSTAYFGNLTSYVPALNSSFLNNLQGTANVPNISTGNTTSFVISGSGENSNFMNFTKDEEPYAGPYITSFEPTVGAPGQYVTIRGSGFGRVQGSSQVFFGDKATGTEASYDFPEVCADSVWGDNQVIIKVPDSLANGNYPLTMVIDTWVINTDELSPNIFNADSSLPLLPSLCKLEPIMGPNNSQVSLWGEYFGSQATGLVRFQLNQDQSGTAIVFWGAEGDADKIETTVHQNAVSGPVRVVQSGSEGNGLNFTVGLCTEAADPDEACGTQICCPVGTYEEGRCKATLDDCYISIPGSVYEWDFSTELGDNGQIGDPCDGDLVTAGCQASSSMCAAPLICESTSCTCQPVGINSCSGYDMFQCVLAEFCPNSPGQCSPYTGGLPQVVGSCVYSCEGVGVCTAASCSYNSNLDRCTNGIDCDLTMAAVDVLDNPITAYCADYSGIGRWHINTSLNCPTGWTSIGGNICVNLSTTCILCNVGFICQDDYDGDGQGLCSVDQDICPDMAICNASNECVADDKAVCECCCEIGQDARDCCTPLICEGDCGTDATGPDTDTFGYCSGCANAGTTQADHDAACNCFGHSGKFCDTGDLGYPDGVCRDCAQLSFPSQCALHSTTCCIDAENGDTCRGGDGTLVSASPGYCAYYDCQSVPNDDLCATSTPYISGIYDNLDSCNLGCASGSSPGGGQSCYDTSSGNCALICSTGYECLGETGCNDGACAPNDTSCLCCCDPSADLCDTINPNYSDLVCQPDIEPCTNAVRGLCCGCTQDDDCGNPNIIGCGSDTCCRARPGIVTTFPADETDYICRNTLIKTEFDQLMDLGSFSGNVIVVGDYGSSQCPAGTQYLALNRQTPVRKNILVRAFYKTLRVFKRFLEPILPSRLAKAYTNPHSSHNYCAITGTVSGYHDTAGFSVLEFSPSNLLDGDRLYYVIVKGDENLDSTSGVLGYWGIGMNGPADSNNTFNNITYNNSYIWSFKTLSEQANNNGVCELDHVDVEPVSYLFQTTVNDTNNENDLNANDDTFDTVKDSDKVFVAQAKTANDEILAPVADYDWSWAWSSNNPTVADSVPGVIGLSANKSLIRAGVDIVDGTAIITAEAQITVDSYLLPSTAGNVYAGRADVYVFVCENPWPPVDSDGTWQPWSDAIEGMSCLPASGHCYNTNYEIYYCRDTGGEGTADDFPAIISSSTIIRGSSSQQSIYKEAYFFREEVPDVSSINLAVSTTSPEGGKVALYWNDIIVPPTESLEEYIVYYGTNPSSYTSSISVSLAMTHTATAPFIVDNLENGVTYYFALTAKYVSQAESDYSNEVSDTPADTQAPGVPANFTANPNDGEVGLSWDANTGDDTVGYKIYYGTSPGIYGYSEKVGDVTEVIIAGLTNGQIYYFTVTALDGYDNESNYASEDQAVPFAVPTNLAATAISGTEIGLSWDTAVGAVSYNVYYDQNSGGPYGSSIIGLTSTTNTISGLSSGTTYYFIVKSVNTDSFESEASSEVSETTNP